VHVPGGMVGGGGRCLLGRRIEAAAGVAAAAAVEVVPGAGIPGACTTSGGGCGGTHVATGDWGSKSGGGGSVRTWGWTKPGGTGWRRRLVAEGGEGSCIGSAGGGVPGYVLRAAAAAALAGCDGERSGGVESARGPGARGPEARDGSGWRKGKECRGGRCG
jgi:hypothetical protein